MKTLSEVSAAIRIFWTLPRTPRPTEAMEIIHDLGHAWPEDELFPAEIIRDIISAPEDLREDLRKAMAEQAAHDKKLLKRIWREAVRKAFRQPIKPQC